MDSPGCSKLVAGAVRILPAAKMRPAIADAQHTNKYKRKKEC
jgi:hypothetical protein